MYLFFRETPSKGEAFHKIASPVKEHLPKTLSFNSTICSWCFLTGVNIWLFTACKNLSLLRLFMYSFFFLKSITPLIDLEANKSLHVKKILVTIVGLKKTLARTKSTTPPPPLKGGPLIGVFPPTDCCKSSSASGCDYSCCQYRRKHVSSAKCG